MPKAPTLSVVFPNFNDARFLPVQLDSMLRQSHLPDEIIIIDDASTDDSVEVIERYIAREPRIRLIRNELNMGVENNINRLIREASGDYLYLSAADDAILPGFFEKSMALLARYPKAGLCTGLGRLMNEAGRDSGLRALPVISRRPCYLSPEEVKRALLKYGRWFALSSMVIRRSALVAEGGQITAAGSFADNLAALVVALRHGACFIPEDFSSWRQKAGSHGSSASGEWERLDKQGALVVDLMRTKYADLFPREFVDRFERHWSYMVSVSAAAKTSADCEQAVIRVFERFATPQELLDRVGLAALRTSLRAYSLLWRLYAMARFAPWRWWVLGRLSIMLNRGVAVLREDQRPYIPGEKSPGAVNILQQ